MDKENNQNKSISSEINEIQPIKRNLNQNNSIVNNFNVEIVELQDEMKQNEKKPKKMIHSDEKKNEMKEPKELNEKEINHLLLEIQHKQKYRTHQISYFSHLSKEMRMIKAMKALNNFSKKEKTNNTLKKKENQDGVEELQTETAKQQKEMKEEIYKDIAEYQSMMNYWMIRTYFENIPNINDYVLDLEHKRKNNEYFDILRKTMNLNEIRNELLRENGKNEINHNIQTNEMNENIPQQINEINEYENDENQMRINSFNSNYLFQQQLSLNYELIQQINNSNNPNQTFKIFNDYFIGDVEYVDVMEEYSDYECPDFQLPTKYELLFNDQDEMENDYDTSLSMKTKIPNESGNHYLLEQITHIEPNENYSNNFDDPNMNQINTNYNNLNYSDNINDLNNTNVNENFINQEDQINNYSLLTNNDIMTTNNNNINNMNDNNQTNEQENEKIKLPIIDYHQFNRMNNENINQSKNHRDYLQQMIEEQTSTKTPLLKGIELIDEFKVTRKLTKTMTLNDWITEYQRCEEEQTQQCPICEFVYNRRKEKSLYEHMKFHITYKKQLTMKLQNTIEIDVPQQNANNINNLNNIQMNRSIQSNEMDTIEMIPMKENESISTTNSRIKQRRKHTKRSEQLNECHMWKENDKPIKKSTEKKLKKMSKHDETIDSLLSKEMSNNNDNLNQMKPIYKYKKIELNSLNLKELQQFISKISLDVKIDPNYQINEKMKVIVSSCNNIITGMIVMKDLDWNSYVFSVQTDSFKNITLDYQEMTYARIGIEFVWVNKQYRNQKIGTQLMKLIQTNFHYGLIYSKRDIAITFPTEESYGFFFKYFGGNLKIYFNCQ